ncbi:MAG: trigger factor [Butyrivibrio sp.]|nr:trigger factor [Butyrivibrio sp.]
MKKKLAMLMAVTLSVASITACSNGTSDNNDTSADNSSASVETSGSESSDAAVAESSEEVVEFGDEAYLKSYTAADYVTLGEYKGVSVEAEEPNVTEEELQSYIEYVLSQELSEVTDRAVQSGDTVDIDYVGKYADSGEEFDGGSAQGYQLEIGSGTFIDGFEDGLIGAETGEVRDLNLTFPETYSATDLAGKEVVFTVTVNKILAPVEELTDDYCANLGIEGVTDIETFKSYLSDLMLTQEQSTYDDTVQNGVLEAVFNDCVFENPPQEMVDRYVYLYNRQLSTMASYYTAMYGTTYTADSVIEQIMSSEGYTGTKEEYLNEIAVKTVKELIMTQAIADLENITVSDDEVLEAVTESMASAASSYEDVDDYISKNSIDLEAYKESMMHDKVVELLAENANVTAAESEE